MVSLSISPRAEWESQPEIMEGLPPAISPTRLSREVVVLAAMGDRVLESVALLPRFTGAGLEQLRTLLSALVAALS